MDSRKKPARTLKDVANAAGVSLGTASKVMAGAEGVSPARRQQVREAARKLGYRRNSLAAELRSSRSTSIGFVVPDLTNSFFIELLCVVEDHALASGYRLLLAHAQEDPAREAERIRFVFSRQVAGMIIIPCHGYEHAIEELRECDVPLVMADRVDNSFPADTVTTDSRRAASDGTDHLIALGHERITFIVNALDLVNSRERADGYLDAMKRAGLARHARVVVCGMTDTESHAATLGLAVGTRAPDRAVHGRERGDAWRTACDTRRRTAPARRHLAALLRRRAVDVGAASAHQFDPSAGRSGGARDLAIAAQAVARRIIGAGASAHESRSARARKHRAADDKTMDQARKRRKRRRPRGSLAAL